jgi:hypothetical protein
MKMRRLLLASSLIWLTSCASSELEVVPRPVRVDDPKGLKLPRGVPRGVDPDGNVMTIDSWFTTPEYERAAIQMVLQEANRVAEDMRFGDEALPITEINAKRLRVSPFGFSYKFNTLGGVVVTSNYVYTIGRGNKFSGLVVANYDQTCLSLNRTLVSLEQMDINAAFQLATQWLTTAGVDVPGLNRDCKAQVAVSPHWSGLSKLGNTPTKDFAPIYYVWWTPYDDRVKFGGADVELFLPTKKLLQMGIHESKYVLRKPVVFTNLDSFFPGTGRVTVFPK